MLSSVSDICSVCISDAVGQLSIYTLLDVALNGREENVFDDKVFLLSVFRGWIDDGG